MLQRVLILLLFVIGYSGLVVGGISRASEKVSYALPSFQLSSSASDEVIYAGGFTCGFELNR